MHDVTGAYFMGWMRSCMTSLVLTGVIARRVVVRRPGAGGVCVIVVPPLEVRRHLRRLNEAAEFAAHKPCQVVEVTLEDRRAAARSGRSHTNKDNLTKLLAFLVKNLHWTGKSNNLMSRYVCIAWCSCWMQPAGDEQLDHIYINFVVRAKWR